MVRIGSRGVLVRAIAMLLACGVVVAEVNEVGSSQTAKEEVATGNQATEVVFPEPEQPYLVQVAAELPDSLDKRKQQLYAAFKAVLLKNSDLPEILEFSKIRAALERPENYLKSFSYSTQKDSVRMAEKRYLRVQFDERAVAALLKNASGMVVIETRPALFMWLLDGRSGTILTKDDEGAEKWQALMARYGITLKLPTQDELVQFSITTADIYERNYAKLLAGGAGEAPVVLIGMVSRTVTEDEWLVTFNLLSGETQTSINTKGTEYEGIITQSVKEVAAHLPISRSPVSRNDMHSCYLRVLNIKSFAELKVLERKLRGVKVLANAELVQAKHRDEVVFRLKYWSFTAELQRILAGLNLVADQDTAQDDTFLTYRLNV